MSNLIIIGMDCDLLNSLKTRISKNEPKDVSKIVSTFLEKHESEIVALPIINERSLMDSQNLQSASDIIKYYTLDNKRENVINELRNIGYNLKYRGTGYLIDTILEVCKNHDPLKNSLQTDFYPIIAEKYGKSVQDIKNCIKTATTSMYIECDIDKMKEYFNLYDDIKPTVRQVVFTVIDNISK